MTSKTENILVVDDNPENLRLLSVILNERGYKVRKAINGQIAIKTVRMLAPDIILLDINMPQINGYEVC
jgi:two-component system sensor histidine kinase/response regulator